MKKIYYLFGMILLAGGVQATVINFNDMDLAPGGTISVDGDGLGTLGTITDAADGTLMTNLTYTVTGLTIDDDGAANDSITVSMSIAGIAGEISWDHANDSGVREWDHDGGTFFVAGEGFSLGTIEVTGTLSSGDALVVNSALYTAVGFRRWANSVDEVITVDGDGDAYTYSDASSVVSLSDTAFSITHVSGGSWNGDDVSFTVDVVPEPATVGMLGIGLISVVVMRRRFKN